MGCSSARQRPSRQKVVCKRPAAKVSGASFANERSRSQILCRSLNGSFAIKCANEKEEKRASQKANAWLEKENRNVGES